MSAAKALTVEGFDADRVMDIVDTSELPEATKEQLRTAVQSARDNPQLVEGVVDQIRAALGF